MAVTSIWSVKGWLGKVVVYAENPDKTENPAYFEKQGMTPEQAQGLSDVIDYASQTCKTQLTNEKAKILRHYVTGINCQPETARDEMLAAKKKFGKEDSVVAYHGIQSFAPGEATPDIAHEIGVRLAKRLWGDKYQVIVATHLDKSNHLHSHFIVNTVSWVDGIRYHRTQKDYYNMQKESDVLCCEYGLSVIENPKRGKSKHYGEWRAEQEGKPTYRSLIKSDVDAAIRQSMTERQFFENLHRMGYETKSGKYFAVCPPGKNKFFRLPKNLGENYTLENICRRILAQDRPDRKIIPPDLPPKKMVLKGNLNNAKRLTGLRALYFHYLYRMGILPRKRVPSPKQVYFLFREDIRFIQNISKETRLLVEHKIDTAQQLTAYKVGLAAKSKELCVARKHLRYQSRSIKDEEKLAAIKAEIAALTNNIGALRREVKLCEDIERRSAQMREKIRRAREDEESKGREMSKNEPFRGCR